MQFAMQRSGQSRDQELFENRYDERAGTLTFTDAEATAWDSIVGRYTAVFAKGERDGILRPNSLLPAAESGGNALLSRDAARQMAAFVTWTAWLSVTK